MFSVPVRFSGLLKLFRRMQGLRIYATLGKFKNPLIRPAFRNVDLEMDTENIKKTDQGFDSQIIRTAFNPADQLLGNFHSPGKFRLTQPHFLPELGEFMRHSKLGHFHLISELKLLAAPHSLMEIRFKFFKLIPLRLFHFSSKIKIDPVEYLKHFADFLPCQRNFDFPFGDRIRFFHKSMKQDNFAAHKEKIKHPVSASRSLR